MDYNTGLPYMESRPVYMYMYVHKCAQDEAARKTGDWIMSFGRNIRMINYKCFAPQMCINKK